MDFIELLKAIILGFVEGMTEFAPVSSTGHMIIVDDMWLNTKEILGAESANTFKIVVQLGSILAVVVVFWKRLLSLIGLHKMEGQSSRHRLKLTHVIVGLLPAGILGVLFEDYIDENLFSIHTVVYALIIGAILMIVADKFRPKVAKAETVDQITYKQAFIVGLFQCLSLWPGFSRSGSTISGGVLVGMNHKTAADFTFIMSVPIMAGASLLSILKSWDQLDVSHIGFYAAGFISAFIFALVSIKFFLKLINRVKLTPFAIYRIVLAIAILFIIW